MTTPKPAYPRSSKWHELPSPTPNTRAFIRMRRKWSLCAITEVFEGDGGWEWIVSTSRRENGKTLRATEDDMREIRHAFGMLGAEEDNHGIETKRGYRGGAVRMLFMRIDPEKRIDCECKETERVVVEPDGFTFTIPREAKLAEPGPLHTLPSDILEHGIVKLIPAP